MSYSTFLNQVSCNLAERFMEIQPNSNLKLHRLTQTVVSMSGSHHEAQVMNYEIRFSKERFETLARLHNESLPEIDLFIKNLWASLKPSHHRVIETGVTHYIRAKNGMYDCAFLESYENNTCLLVIRASSSYPTQSPQPFAPLYTDSFERLFEVQQGCWAITRPSAEKNSLATWHLASCIAFIAYDKLNKIGVLAHIDKGTPLEMFFQTLRNLSRGQRNFDYVLLGGLFQSERQTLIDEVTKHSTKDLQFRCIRQIGAEGLSVYMGFDSCWGVSMRLSRSVALDTTDPDPLEHLMSYEPVMNKDSSIHSRTGTQEEADQFVAKREKDPSLNLSYTGI